MSTLRCAPADLPPTHVRIERGAAAAEALQRHASFVLIDASVRAVRADYRSLFPQLELQAGEELKTLATAERVLRRLAQEGLDRDATLIAIGGGTLGDLAGVVAALYLRGIRLISVPTTLLAMLDSSIGGKAAVNLPEGKNLIGQLWPAAEVIIDPDHLATLPPREIASGLGEALKMAIGLDAALFDLLERERDAVLRRDVDVLATVIDRAVRAKVRIVELDPHDHGHRHLLNLGHTLGHALEAHGGFTCPHGVAVARGLHHVVELARQLGVLAADDATRARALLIAYGFEATPLPAAAELLPFVARDKKVRGGVLRAVLPTAIGRSEVVAMTPAEFLVSLRDPSSAH